MASDDEMYECASDEDELADDQSYRDDADDEVEAAVEGSFRGQDGHDAEVLGEEDILEKQSRAVSEAVAILNLSEEQAAILLRSYKWSVSHATEEWFNNEAKVRERLGLLDPCGDPAGAGKHQEASDSKVLCGICFEEFGKEETSSPPCGHSFCNACWTNYFNVSIEGGHGCLSLHCPKPDCHVAVGDSMILSLSGPAQQQQFKKFLLRSYVDSSTNVKWCPAPGCCYAVALDSWRVGPSGPSGVGNLGGMGEVGGMGGTGGMGETGGVGVTWSRSMEQGQGQGIFGVTCMSANVVCKCRHSFCWNCLEEPHRPVDCGVVKKWLVKNSAESENMNWILANSKACPKCQRPIEKNHGCMHMTCSAPCKHEFCWLCLGDWKAHSDSTGGFYACNRYEAAKKKGDLTEEDQRKERARQSLERYLHYYERWATNETSRKKAVESLHEVQERQADSLRELLGLPSAELSFLAEAWQQVVDCRRVLKWTYAYGYYLDGESEQDKRRRSLFEYLQGQADGALGGLHKWAEKDVERFVQPKFRPSFDEASPPWLPPSLEEFLDFKSNLTRMTAVTRNFFDNLVKALESGLAEVTDAAMQPMSASAARGKGKGKARESRKRRRRGSSKKGGGEEAEEEEEQGRIGENSDLAVIDSGDDSESGEEGDTGEALGSGAGPNRSEGGPAREASEYWSCSHCTYANRVGAGGTCTMCRLPRNSID